MKRSVLFAIALTAVLLFVVVLLYWFPAARGPHAIGSARAEVDMLACALKQYYTEYHCWPLSTNQAEDSINNAELMDILCARTNSTVCKEHNSKMLCFLQLKQTGSKGESVDPWGTPYRIIIDTDLNKAISVGGKTLKEEVAVWSCGKNKKNEWGQGDDVASWRQRRGGIGS